ncbi:MAG: NADP-dependent isocitrate dehydrogenase, partial [Pseudoclavibacter sp.]|nr:NADP-dependent isocitrate dehydrogenase [Pseudoclavibacter sp.]
LDGNQELIDFCRTLEEVVVQTVESGKMTKDLALLVGEGTPHLTTDEFMDAIAERLRERLGA